MENCPSKYLVDNSKEISSRCFEDVGNSFNDQVELSFEFFFFGVNKPTQKIQLIL